MAHLDIIVTDDMLAWAEQRVAAGDFASTNAYFADLFRRDGIDEERLVHLGRN